MQLDISPDDIWDADVLQTKLCADDIPSRSPVYPAGLLLWDNKNSKTTKHHRAMLNKLLHNPININPEFQHHISARLLCSLTQFRSWHLQKQKNPKHMALERDCQSRPGLMIGDGFVLVRAWLWLMFSYLHEEENAAGFDSKVRNNTGE